MKIGNENSRVKANFPASLQYQRPVFDALFPTYQLPSSIRPYVYNPLHFTMLSWDSCRVKHAIQDESGTKTGCMYDVQ